MLDDPLDDLLAFKKCHVVTFLPIGTQLMCRMVLYGSHKAIIQMSDEPRLWNSKIPPDGLVWVIFPPLGTFVGPLSLPDYISACVEATPNPTRSLLNDLLFTGDDLPPKHLVNDSA